MKKIIHFIFILSLVGCTKVAHINELLMLQRMSNEVEDMDKFVEESDAKLALLIEAYHDGSLKDYTTKKKILKKFGPPIQDREMVHDGKEVDRWLYRQAAATLSVKEKIYLYFNIDGDLISWEYFEDPKKK